MSTTRKNKYSTIVVYCFLFFTILFVITNTRSYASEATTALIHLSADGPFELIINEKSVKSADHADKIEIETPIKAGVNNVILKLHRGTAAIRITAPGLDITGDNWKLAPLSDPSTTFDGLSGDSEWETAAKIGDNSLLGSIVGKQNQPVTLQRTILWKKTRVWPSPSSAFQLPENATIRMNLIVDGITGKRLTNWTTYLALPAGIECLGSSGFYGTTNAQQPRFAMKRLGKVKIDGVMWDCYRITADKPIEASKHDVMKIVQVFLRYKGEIAEDRSDMKIIYWSEANDGAVVEGRQSVPVQVIEGLNGKQPTNYIFQIYGGWFGRLDDQDMREEILKTAKLAGFNHIVNGNLKLYQFW